MYIDTVTAERNSEISSDDARCVANVSVVNEIDEYVPNWEMKIEAKDGNSAESVITKNADLSNI